MKREVITLYKADRSGLSFLFSSRRGKKEDTSLKPRHKALEENLMSIAMSSGRKILMLTPPVNAC